MKTMSLKRILIDGALVLLGAACGGGGVYIWCKNTEEARIDQAAEEIRQAYKKARSEQNTDDSNKDEQDIEKPQETPKNGLKTHSEVPEEGLIRQTAEEIKQVNNYGGYFANQKPTEDIVDPRQVLINDIADAMHPSERDNEPYVLTEEMLEDEEAASDMTFCTLYSRDRVLADDLNNDSMDIYQTIGWDLFNKFLNAPDTEEIYVKDPRTDTVYDIVKEDASYSEMMSAYHGGV